jgi:hypothetical protein
VDVCSPLPTGNFVLRQLGRTSSASSRPRGAGDRKAAAAQCRRIPWPLTAGVFFRHRLGGFFYTQWRGGPGGFNWVLGCPVAVCRLAFDRVRAGAEVPRRQPAAGSRRAAGSWQIWQLAVVGARPPAASSHQPVSQRPAPQTPAASWGRGTQLQGVPMAAATGPVACRPSSMQLFRCAASQ